MGTRISEVDSILFIRSAERSHSGKYTLSVQIENMCDSADINIQVVGESPPPLWPSGITGHLGAGGGFGKPQLFFKLDEGSSFRSFSSPLTVASHQSLAADNPAPSALYRCRVRTGGLGCLADNFLGIISMYG